MRVTQTLLRRLRTAEVFEHVVVHFKTEREVLQLLKLVGVGKCNTSEKSRAGGRSGVLSE